MRAWPQPSALHWLAGCVQALARVPATGTCACHAVSHRLPPVQANVRAGPSDFGEMRRQRRCLCARPAGVQSRVVFLTRTTFENLRHDASRRRAVAGRVDDVSSQKLDIAQAAVQARGGHHRGGVPGGVSPDDFEAVKAIAWSRWGMRCTRTGTCR